MYISVALLWHGRRAAQTGRTAGPCPPEEVAGAWEQREGRMLECEEDPARECCARGPCYRLAGRGNSGSMIWLKHEDLKALNVALVFCHLLALEHPSISCLSYAWRPAPPSCRAKACGPGPRAGNANDCQARGVRALGTGARELVSREGNAEDRGKVGCRGHV